MRGLVVLVGRTGEAWVDVDERGEGAGEYSLRLGRCVCGFDLAGALVVLVRVASGSDLVGLLL